MIFSKKFSPLFALALLLLGACKSVLVYQAAPAPDAKPAFSKLLFVEHAKDSVTYRFYNNLRKDLRRELAARNIEAEFVRVTPTVSDMQKRMDAAVARLNPQAVVNLEHTITRQYKKWGPLHHDVRALDLILSVQQFSDQSPVWRCTASIDQYWGVDVATTQVAEDLVSKMIEAGVIR